MAEFHDSVRALAQDFGKARITDDHIDRMIPLYLRERDDGTFYVNTIDIAIEYLRAYRN